MMNRWPLFVFAAVMAAIPLIPGVPPFWIVLLDNIGLAALVAIERQIADVGVHPDIASYHDLAHAFDLKASALAAREALNIIRQDTTLDWTFLSPAALLAPGPRTGKFRIGADDMLMNGDHPANISVADLAVAIADEIETPRHIRKRFTVAY